MGIWLELGIFGLVFVFAFWQMHDVRRAQEQTRQQRAREKALLDAPQQAVHDAIDLPIRTDETDQTPKMEGAATHAQTKSGTQDSV
ncbi:hypothetical protein [Limnohabitans sp.]|jgi:hypothetical protein|uniref:hypothetical protein n=1 Tax=Limnohabitans sp. TaxID=1907725 RepID=UPI0037BF4381